MVLALNILLKSARYDKVATKFSSYPHFFSSLARTMQQFVIIFTVRKLRPKIGYAHVDNEKQEGESRCNLIQ